MGRPAVSVDCGLAVSHYLPGIMHEKPKAQKPATTPRIGCFGLEVADGWILLEMHAFPRVWGSARRGGGCGGEEEEEDDDDDRAIKGMERK